MINAKAELEYWNSKLRDKSPEEIIKWAFSLSENRIVTTSFGIYSSVLLDTITKLDPMIRVVWCDTLYNHPNTYQHANHLIKELKLNIHKYRSLMSKDEIDRSIGLPDLENDTHKIFSEVVKLEPFRRALRELKPEVWFTNIRIRQTEYRDELSILSLSKDGILKVSPFYYWSDNDLDDHLRIKGLPKNHDYFDPTKVLRNRECGIHLQ